MRRGIHLHGHGKMKVLIGTTNQSKVGRFKGFLTGYDVDFLTLDDLNITSEPEEVGSSPLENAIIKSRFYGQFFDRVICNDSGLYFEELSLDDPRQPGLNIRTPNNGKRLNDEEMISYYASLISSLGGKVTAYYSNGIAVYDKGKVLSFSDLENEKRVGSFFMTDTPSDKRHPGWPLDSLSLNRKTMTYFTEDGNNLYDDVKEQIMIGEYRKRVVDFLVKALGL